MSSAILLTANCFMLHIYMLKSAILIFHRLLIEFQYWQQYQKNSSNTQAFIFSGCIKYTWMKMSYMYVSCKTFFHICHYFPVEKGRFVGWSFSDQINTLKPRLMWYLTRTELYLQARANNTICGYNCEPNLQKIKCNNTLVKMENGVLNICFPKIWWNTDSNSVLILQNNDVHLHWYSTSCVCQ